ncbi:MAG: NADH:ubiquinone oxidoreductase [Tannerella sp.]|jgi:Ni,Fe-hydrogenase III small subunit|nr:NADH:ubiquinone oxidoreductase [Tannerella sp.]
MMFPKEFKILESHGWQYVRDLKTVKLPALFRGRPEISSDITPEDAVELEDLCPAGAIASVPEFSLDMGKCLFCKECQFRKPGIVNFTSDYKIATVDRNALRIKAGKTNPVDFHSELVGKEIGKLFGRALNLRQVSAGGDNSCEMELNACGNVNFDMGRFGIEFQASPRHCDGMAVTGPVSKNMAEALKLCYEAIPAPKILILAGTEAISGGLFASSNAVDRSFLDSLHVDLYVPGNPAHPLTFINGVLNLISNSK